MPRHDTYNDPTYRKNRLALRVGQIMEVLVDEVDEEGAIGRTFADAPEIDGVIYLNGETDLKPGDVVKVLVEHSDEYDLGGSLAN